MKKNYFSLLPLAPDDVTVWVDSRSLASSIAPRCEAGSVQGRVRRGAHDSCRAHYKKSEEKRGDSLGQSRSKNKECCAVIAFDCIWGPLENICLLFTKRIQPLQSYCVIAVALKHPALSGFYHSKWRFFLLLHIDTLVLFSSLSSL